MRAALAFIAFVASMSPVWAWGPEGHGLTAAIAEANLTPAARGEVQRLLKLEDYRHLDEISSWADAVRDARPETAPWHYVDIPLKSKVYKQSRDCHYDKDNNKVQELTCVVVILPKWVATLADKTRPDPERLEALKWIVHFTGDVHQPLHTEDNKDRGGNEVHVMYFGEAKNLHSIWDGEVIEHNYGWKLGPNFSFDHDAIRKAAGAIDKKIVANSRKTWLSQGASAKLAAEVKEWANWSHSLAVPAYANLPARPRPPGWEKGYQAYAWPVVKVQLSAAGVRLAGILNEALK